MARETVTVDRRLYLSADDELVDVSEPVGKRLWCIPGDELDRDTAKRYGVKRGAGEPESAAEGSAASEPEPEGETEPEAETETFVCDECDYEAKSAAGLAAHQRTHQG